MALLDELRASIYEEHADEASFLCEQRARWLQDAALSFDEIADLEARREAHLDGLVLGGDAALQLLTPRALEGEDAGIVESALRVACRLTRGHTCAQILEAVGQSGDAEHARGASAALCSELPSALTDLASDGLHAANGMLVVLWARVIGYRRLPLAEELRAALAHHHQLPPAQLADVVWALGELGEPSPLSCRAALSTNSPELTQAVLLATLKSGRLAAADLDALGRSFQGWAAIPGVLAGIAP